MLTYLKGAIISVLDHPTYGFCESPCFSGPLSGFIEFSELLEVKKTSVLTVVGLTGAFGSGCTTASHILRDERNFSLIRLSALIEEQWQQRSLDSDIERLATRQDLQQLGDELREKHGPGFLARLATKRIHDQSTKGMDSFVIDGIRNTHEIREFQDAFGYNFTLIAVLADFEERWRRIGADAYKNKGLGLQDFLLDDARDRDEEIPTGQQVELCIDRADAVIDNSSTVTRREFEKKLLDLTDLIIGKKPRRATMHEIYMNIAYTAALSSKCIKRNVGAVVVGESEKIVGVGYNENPISTHPCIEEPEYEFKCFRDIVRNRHFKILRERGVRCPVCGQPLGDKPGPPWRCEACAKSESKTKTNLEALFFPDRALNWCTAIHAEVRAIFAAGAQARRGRLYTTTFPCFQCAEKIIESGISAVQYTEAYPDTEGEFRLKLANVSLTRFEGIRSASFERLFGPTRT